MNYGLKDQRVGNLHANVVFVPKHSFNNSWMTTPWGCVNLMQYIQRLEQRIETLERQNLDRNNLIHSLPPLLVPPSAPAPPQENEIVEVEGAVPETS